MEVLILEDDDALRFALSQALEDEGHQIHQARNISEAISILNRAQPKLLLLDLMIGENCSIQLADLAGYRLPDAEILYLTGSDKFPNGELFEFSKNIAMVLRKPVDFRQLKAVCKHIELSKVNRPLSDMPSDHTFALANF